MNLIPAEKEDAEAIYFLLYEVALWVETKCKGQWPMDWLESKKDEIFCSVANGNFYTVRSDDHLIAVVEVKTDSEAIWGHNTASAYYVHKLAVRRNCESKGLGKQILNAIFNLAKANGIRLVRLDCVTSNTKLHSFYLGAGFIHAGYADDEGTGVTLFERSVN